MTPIKIEPNSGVKMAGVKLALAAEFHNGVWMLSGCFYNSLQQAKDHIGDGDRKFIWPVRFDADGSLIVPEEFK